MLVMQGSLPQTKMSRPVEAHRRRKRALDEFNLLRSLRHRIEQMVDGPQISLERGQRQFYARSNDVENSQWLHRQGARLKLIFPAVTGSSVDDKAHSKCTYC